jgi:hypothetical protein
MGKFIEKRTMRHNWGDTTPWTYYLYGDMPLPDYYVDEENELFLEAVGWNQNLEKMYYNRFHKKPIFE